MQVNLAKLDVADNVESAYYALLASFQEVQLKVNQLSGQFGQFLPEPPMLLTYKQFIEDVKPTLVMWDRFSLFAFAYAQSQLEILSEINEYIKNTYHSIIIDLVNNELLNLQGDSWVRTGLGDIEKSIALAAELQQKQQQAERIRIAEQQAKTEELTHQALLKQQEVQADIEKYEQKEARWLAAKAKKNELQLQHKYR